MDELEGRWAELKSELKGDLFCIDAYQQVLHPSAVDGSKSTCHRVFYTSSFIRGIGECGDVQEACNCAEDPYNCRRTCGLCEPQEYPEHAMGDLALAGGPQDKRSG